MTHTLLCRKSDRDVCRTPPGRLGAESARTSIAPAAQACTPSAPVAIMTQQHDRLIEQVRVLTQTTCSVAEIRGLLENVSFDSTRVHLMIDAYFEGSGEIKQLERDSWAEVSKGKSKKGAKVRYTPLTAPRTRSFTLGARTVPSGGALPQALAWHVRRALHALHTDSRTLTPQPPPSTARSLCTLIIRLRSMRWTPFRMAPRMWRSWAMAAAVAVRGVAANACKPEERVLLARGAMFEVKGVVGAAEACRL